MNTSSWMLPEGINPDTINSKLMECTDFDVEKYLKAYRTVSATNNAGDNAQTSSTATSAASTNYQSTNQLSTLSIVDKDDKDKQPIKDEKSFETIARNMKTYLKRHRMREALDYFKSSVYKEIETNGSVVAFDLVQAIGERLQRLLEYRFRTFNICVQMLIELCKLVSDKELHIIFLAELEKDWKIRKSRLRRLNNNIDPNDEDDEDDEDDDDIDGRDIDDDYEDDDNNDDESNNYRRKERKKNNIDIDDDYYDFQYEECYCFLAFLEPLKIVLLRMEKNDFSDFIGAMLVIHRHIEILPLQFLNGYTNPNNDGHREIVKSNGMKNLCLVLSGYFKFIQTFVNEASIKINENYDGKNWKSQSELLLKSLILLFNYPFRYLVLHSPIDDDEDDDDGDDEEVGTATADNSSSAINVSTSDAADHDDKDDDESVDNQDIDDFEELSFDEWKEIDFPNTKLYNAYNVQSCRKLASLYIGLISSLQPNFIKLLQNQLKLTQDDYSIEYDSIDCLTDEQCTSGLAVIASVIAYQPETNFLPLVYRSDYIFKLQLPLIKNLLDDYQTILVHEKGLKLMEKLLKRCKNFDEELLDYLRIDRYPIDISLINIMKYSQNKQLRLKACETFKIFILSFEPNAMNKFLYSLLIRPSQEIGAQCLIIGLFKDQLLNCKTLYGQNLHRFIRAIINICSKETNINSDIFFSFINFLRFLVAFDKKSNNITGFWDIWSVVSEQFLKPMKKRIDDYEAQIKLQLRSLTEEKIKNKNSTGKDSSSSKKKKKKRFSDIKIANPQSDDNEIDFNAEPTLEQKHSQILCEQQNLDLLRSICARLDEVVNSKK